ncbi:MAG: hypothetical protein QRY16_01370 [Enterobacterales bacterium endosymbiont of Blomia tropicalis]|uniref:hypothetical protein n=1 Tax=Mixta mediterraneensis TaxID=2758443 RepID=UPI0025A7D21F|nr:hypothetical protein [Mixta mediterraneensis]MDL4912475.1 hypothetical protein [Mixta mediterraneensis]
MTTKRLALFHSRSVSRVMLDDLRTILSAGAASIFINGLDESQYATVECLQNAEDCALIASAIVVWRQPGQIHRLTYKKGEASRDVDDATQFQLFTMLKTHRAVLQIA